MTVLSSLTCPVLPMKRTKAVKDSLPAASRGRSWLQQNATHLLPRSRPFCPPKFPLNPGLDCPPWPLVSPSSPLARFLFSEGALAWSRSFFARLSFEMQQYAS